MARDWWRVVLAALATAMLGAACVLGAHAQATNEEPDAEEAKAPAGEQPKASAKKKKQDPADAQRAIDAAAKALQAGKVEQAVQALSATLAGGNLPPAVMAKAFYVRGMAHRQQKKPAQALSDFTSALWLKGGLGGEERTDALKQRAAAYGDAGLTERGEAVAPVAAEHPVSPAKKAGGNWLSNFFSSPEPPAPPASQPKVTPAIEKTEAPAVAKAPKVIGGWASKTQVQADREALAAPATTGPLEAEAPPAREEAPPLARAEGRFQIQVATVRTKAEALALAAKARREHAAVLAASEPEIDQAVLGNMGSFYRVRFGPFANAQQTQAVCAKLKGSGLDCMPVTP